MDYAILILKLHYAELQRAEEYLPADTQIRGKQDEIVNAISAIERERNMHKGIRDKASESMGGACDRLDGLIAGLILKIPPQLHLEQLGRILPEIAKDLKLAYIDVFEENPWEDSPFDPKQ